MKLVLIGQFEKYEGEFHHVSYDRSFYKFEVQEVYFAPNHLGVTGFTEEPVYTDAEYCSR